MNELVYAGDVHEYVYVEYYDDVRFPPESFGEMTKEEALARFGEPTLDQGSEWYYF